MRPIHERISNNIPTIFHELTLHGCHNHGGHFLVAMVKYEAYMK